MKIGTGGPKARAVQEVVRVLDAGRLRPPMEEYLIQGEDLAQRRMLYKLNKAVEQMRRAAERFNQFQV